MNMYRYNVYNQRVGTLRDNGRSSSRDLTCTGDLLWEVDEDGVRTDYAYDSARTLTEVSRAEVLYNGTQITPETITEFARDAAGRITTVTTHTGAMCTTRSTVYDLAGREVASTDELGRTTTTAYSADGLTTTVTTPAGATLITTTHPDGSPAHLHGTGQRELYYVYDLNGDNLRETVKLADNTTVLSQSITNGFDQTLVQAQASAAGFIYQRAEFNALGQLTKSYADSGWNTPATAPTLYEYDAFGNVSKQTLALADSPTPQNSPVQLTAYATELMEDGVYQVTTRTRYNAEAQPLTTVQKQLISRTSPTLEQKSVITNERGLTSTSYTLYTAPTVRTSYSSIPTSTITAQAVVADGFTLSQTDHAGVTTTAIRSYTATGMVLVQTDGRGNATTTQTDVAGRTTAVTDAAGNTTTTAYHAHFDQPAMVTDALGNTACYQYDIRGRKTAEWGTAIQPVCYGYDSADRLTSLTTFRAGTEIISVNPASRTDGDTTTWGYHDASGMEIRKTYADGKSVTKTYDAFNRLLTETDGRGVTKTHSYEHARSLLLGTTYTNVTSPTTARAYTYNHLGQLLTVADAAGERTFSYNTYGELAADSLLAGGKTHLVTELQDAYGRSAGYTYTKDGAVQQTVSTGYGDDGRIASAGFVHGGAQKLFTYAYLTGTHLLQTLTKPNNMSLNLSYEAQRDLLTGMVYKRSNTTVATRSYTYDTLGRPSTRSTAKDGATVNDSFDYNSRSELSTATVNNAAYSYDYDNIGNRETTQEAAESATTYESNNLNQYTAISDFEPTYDDAGNQTLVKTSTGIWSVVYDAENRPISFTNAESATVVECTYDYMGRRATKKVTVNGAVTLHHRYLYRGYLQIACCDLTRSNHPCLWLITWDPSQATATRPLAIQKDGTWYTYGWDLTKNICEVYGQHGYIRTNYTYSPFGQVTATGDVTQPIQWSSEYHDTELALVYYNYRHYNPTDGRWLGRDRIEEINLYTFTKSPLLMIDILGDSILGIIGAALIGAAVGALVDIAIQCVSNIIEKGKPLRLGELDERSIITAAIVGAVLPGGKSLAENFPKIVTTIINSWRRSQRIGTFPVEPITKRFSPVNEAKANELIIKTNIEWNIYFIEPAKHTIIEKFIESLLYQLLNKINFSYVIDKIKNWTQLSEEQTFSTNTSNINNCKKELPLTLRIEFIIEEKEVYNSYDDGYFFNNPSMQRMHPSHTTQSRIKNLIREEEQIYSSTTYTLDIPIRK